MIRIHPGRAWRQNARLLSQLRAATDERTTIVDAVGIEVDGVDLAAGLSEDSVLQVTADLATAVAQLVSGSTRASVGFRAAAVELLLLRRRDRVRLSLVQVRRPAGGVHAGVEVDLEALRRAALDSSRTLLRELGGINPALLRASNARRLAAAVRRLAGPGAAPPEPVRAPRKRSLAFATPGLPSCSFEFQDDTGLLETYAGRRPDMASLLVRGRLGLRLTRTSTLWEGEGLLFLMLREQTAAGLSVVRALEAGEKDHAFPLCDGGVLSLDLEAGRVALPRHRQPVPCDGAALARAIFHASSHFVGWVTARCPEQRRNGHLLELGRSAEEGLARCEELARPARARRSPPRRKPAPPKTEAPLVTGRLCRLRYHRLWASTRRLHATALLASGSQLVVCGDSGAVGLSTADGRALWSVPRGSASALPLPGGELLVASGRQIVRFTSDGAPRWSGTPLGPAAAIGSLTVAANGLAAVAASATEAALFQLESGRALWRFGPPGCGALTVAAAPDLCLLGTSDGRLYGIDPGRGRVVWRSRLGAKLVGPLVVWGQRVAVMTRRPGGARLHALDLATGRAAELPEPELAHPGSLGAVGGTLVAAGTLGGEGRVVGYVASELAWSWRGEPLGQGLPQLCPTPDGMVVRGSRRLGCLDPSGKVRWELAFEDEIHGGPPPLWRRGVLFALADRGLLALDPGSGRVLGEASVEAPLWPALLAVDDRLTLYTAEEEGAIEAHALETFLSVV